MRLLYLTRGCSIHDLRFLQAFANHGVTVGYASISPFITGASKHVLPKGVVDLGCLGLDSKPSTAELLSVVPKFQRMAAEFAPEIVFAGPVHDGAYVAAKAGLPCRWLAQSWAFDVLWEIERDADALARAKFVLQTCPAILADSMAIARQCETLAGQPIITRFLIPWGIDLATTVLKKTRAAARMKVGVRDQTVFLCTRGLEPIYQIDILLEGFHQLLKACSEAVLILSSDGSLSSQFEAWIKANDLDDSVKILGSTDHDGLMDLFAAADFYVSSAASDGTSIALLEAMYLGVIPIVNDVGGNPEWIQPGINGWLVQPGDPRGFFTAMAQAYQLSFSRKLEISQRNRAEVCSRADWKVNFGKLVHDISAFSKTW